MSQPPPSYSKPWLPYAEQVAQLVSRGLVVADPKTAETFLKHVNYFRLSGYCLAFEQARHQFLPGIAFEDIRAAYQFDLILRDLLTEALEVVEIDLRTCFAHHFGQSHGAFGHTDPAKFFHRFEHADWMIRLHDEVERSSELFVQHFRNGYAEYPDLPIWMLMEIMSFGTLTRMYRGMERADQKAIAGRYGIQPVDFGTIILHLVYVRNLCAHHARLWDRVWDMKASLPRGQFWQPPHVPGNDRLYSTALLLYRFLKWCPAIGSFAADWRARLHALLDTPPNVPTALAKMGMPTTWKHNLEWR